MFLYDREQFYEYKNICIYIDISIPGKTSIYFTCLCDYVIKFKFSKIKIALSKVKKNYG